MVGGRIQAGVVRRTITTCRVEPAALPRTIITAFQTQAATASHTHTEVTNGSHAHTVTSAELGDAIPYYTLAFIIKL